MKYPQGIKKNNNVTYVNYSNRGMSLESLINDANNYYIDSDIAIIYKKPTPIGLIDVDYKKGLITKAFFKDKSTFDYNGVYKGKALEFEAKESKSKTSFPLSNIHEHQIQHLRRVIKHGAIAFLIVYISDKYYLLDGIKLLEFIDNNTRKSIPIEYFINNAHEIKISLKPNLDYIKIVNEIYFKGE